MGIKQFWSKNGATILTGVTVVGVVASGYLWYKAGPKVEDHKKRWKEREENGEEVSLQEKALDIFPDIALAVSVSAVTVGAAVGSNALNANNIAAMTLVAKEAKDYTQNIQAAAKKVVGEEKANEIEEEARSSKRARVVEDVVTEYHTYDTGEGDHVFIDEETHIRIRASKSFVKLGFKSWCTKVNKGLGLYGAKGGAYSELIQEWNAAPNGMSQRFGITPEEAENAQMRLVDDEFGMYTIIEIWPKPHCLD